MLNLNEKPSIYTITGRYHDQGHTLFAAVLWSYNEQEAWQRLCKEMTHIEHCFQYAKITKGLRLDDAFMEIFLSPYVTNLLQDIEKSHTDSMWTQKLQIKNK